MRKGRICAIFARNTIGFLMGFRATTNHTRENGDKKQNTLPYTLQVKVVEVCLVGAGDGKLLRCTTESLPIIIARQVTDEPKFSRISSSPKQRATVWSPFALEQVMRIELTTTAWEAVVLPLNYTRKVFIKNFLSSTIILTQKTYNCKRNFA